MAQSSGAMPPGSADDAVAVRTAGSSPPQSHQYAMAGMLFGALVAVIILVAVSVILLRAEGSTYKVLVAVWLWALSVLGLFSTIGYVLGKGADAVAASEMNA